MKYKIALIQLNNQDDTDQNIESISSFVKQAAAAGAEWILLPENAGHMIKSINIFGKEKLVAAEKKFLSAMKELAKETKIFLLVGSTLVEGKNGKLLNRSVFLNDNGEEIAIYDKIHLFDATMPDGKKYFEPEHIEPGNKAVVAKTPFGNVGLSICYDVRFPQLYRKLAKKGAEIITVPAAFVKHTGQMHWHSLLRARAIENGCFILAPAQTGTHPGGRHTFGHSIAIDPFGKIIAEMGEEEGFILAEIDLGQVKAARQLIPSLTHDRKFD